MLGTAGGTPLDLLTSEGCESVSPSSSLASCKYTNQTGMRVPQAA